jgi:hypothetical protein
MRDANKEPPPGLVEVPETLDLLCGGNASLM